MSMVPWVYVCDADHVYGAHTVSPPVDEAQQDIDAIEKIEGDPEIAKLQSIGLSRGIIDLVKQNFYTKEQLDILIAQRLHVKDTIDSDMRTTHKAPKTVVHVDSGVEITRSIPEEQVVGKDNANRGSVRRANRCVQTGCPRCRPHFRDRACVSFGAVFAGEIPPILPSELSDLHIADAAIVRKIGERETRVWTVHPMDSSFSDTECDSSRSTTTIHTSASEECVEVKDRVRRSRGFYGLGRTTTNSTEATTPERSGISAGLKARYQRLKHKWRRNQIADSSSDVSRVTLPLSGTGALRSFTQPAADFDLNHLRQQTSTAPAAQKQSIGRTASTDAMRHDSFGLVEVPEKQEDHDLDGSEVSVDGGVALTEEAVEMHTPDLITQI